MFQSIEHNPIRKTIRALVTTHCLLIKYVIQIPTQFHLMVFLWNGQTPAIRSTPTQTQKMIKLVPKVLNTLVKQDGLDIVMTHFFEMVSNEGFPLDNIAFLLWTKVVKWFSCTSTTAMRYSDTTKLFWKLGLRIFGGRFVNFMGGYKSHGDTTLRRPASSPLLIRLINLTYDIYIYVPPYYHKTSLPLNIIILLFFVFA